VGAKKKRIEISDKEWEAIQAGAISDQKLKDILANTDSEYVKKLATPKNSSVKLTQSQINRIRAMYNTGYSMADIAESMGVSASTVREYAK
jgi:DNA-binding NarL/FixJ family response regulator